MPKGKQYKYMYSAIIIFTLAIKKNEPLEPRNCWVGIYKLQAIAMNTHISFFKLKTNRIIKFVLLIA